MQLECWNIQGASFHFGTRGLGQEQTTVTMPSDSLFAALVARLAHTHGSQAVDEFCGKFLGGQPPFVLSSTFPRAGEVRFLPVPMLARREETPGVSAKDLKRIQYVSEGAFRNMLAGTSLAKLYNPAHTLQGGKVLVSPEDFNRLPRALQVKDADLWKVEQRPRVSLDRNSSTSNLFHIGQVHFSEGCGLWFAVQWVKADENLRKRFTGMLHELAQTGFGAERGVGLGIATVSGPFSMELPDVKGAWVTLSRYLPTKEETDVLAKGNSAYAIEAVGGWLDSPTNMGQRRRPVNLIEEGSVLGGKLEDIVPGQIVDARPSYPADTDPLGHAVYRNGFALAVGIEGGGK